MNGHVLHLRCGRVVLSGQARVQVAGRRRRGSSTCSVCRGSVARTTLRRTWRVVAGLCRGCAVSWLRWRSAIPWLCRWGPVPWLGRTGRIARLRWTGRVSRLGWAGRVARLGWAGRVARLGRRCSIPRLRRAGRVSRLRRAVTTTCRWIGTLQIEMNKRLHKDSTLNCFGVFNFSTFSKGEDNANNGKQSIFFPNVSKLMCCLKRRADVQSNRTAVPESKHQQNQVSALRRVHPDSNSTVPRRNDRIGLRDLIRSVRQCFISVNITGVSLLQNLFCSE